MSEDKAIHTLYERIGHLLFEQPCGELGRYLTYYAEDRLYLVFDLWYHGFFLVEASSPKDAIDKVNCDQLRCFTKEQTMRIIDADALISKYIDTDIEKFNNFDVKIVLENLKQNILKAPTIKTKQVKYYDEDDSVWKIGRVIVDE